MRCQQVGKSQNFSTSMLKKRFEWWVVCMVLNGKHMRFEKNLSEILLKSRVSRGTRSSGKLWKMLGTLIDSSDGGIHMPGLAMGCRVPKVLESQETKWSMTAYSIYSLDSGYNDRERNMKIIGYFHLILQDSLPPLQGFFSFSNYEATRKMSSLDPIDFLSDYWSGSI